MCALSVKRPFHEAGKSAVIFLLSFALVNSAFGEVLFSDDFESGNVTSGPSPKWSWAAPATVNNVTSTMDVGPNDIYLVSSKVVHSGNYSLEMKLDGRNGWCNVCGSKEVALTSSALSSGCVQTNGSPWASTIFNASNGFSKWTVTSQNSGQVCFNKSSPAVGSIFGNSQSGFAVGDKIKLPFKCGTNGTIGGDISRKSDCNKAINYLTNVKSTDIGFGETISRRFYVYIPSSAKLPNITLKLGYSHWKVGTQTRSVKLKLSVQRNLQIVLNAPNGESIVMGGYNVGKDKWYYFEELFVRESSSNANDAEYHLFYGTAGDNMSVPIVSRTGYTLGTLVDMSIHGNWQHNNDLSGSVFFDDILFSKAYVGPIGTPKSPSTFTAKKVPGS